MQKEREKTLFFVLVQLFFPHEKAYLRNVNSVWQSERVSYPISFLYASMMTSDNIDLASVLMG